MDYLEIVRIWLLNINQILDKQNTFIPPQIIILGKTWVS